MPIDRPDFSARYDFSQKNAHVQIGLIVNLSSSSSYSERSLPNHEIYTIMYI